MSESNFSNVALSGEGQGDGENGVGMRLQVFTSMVIIGYFGVKIVYATFFGLYPQKYYNETSTSTEGKDGKPVKTVQRSQWNNELYDLVTVMILSFIVFLFANVASKRMITGSTSLSPSFLVGYLVGLGYPASKKMFSDLEAQNSIGLKYLAGFFYMVVALFAIASNFMTDGGNLNASHVNYIIYLVVISLILYGLYYSRPGRKIQLISNTPIGEDTNTLSSAFESARVNLNIPFVSFIVLLLFQRDPSQDAFRLVVYFLFGMLLGIMVSGVSFYGIQYMIDQESVPAKPVPAPASPPTPASPSPTRENIKSNDKKDIELKFKKATGESQGLLDKIKEDTESFFSLKNLKRVLLLILIILIVILLSFTVLPKLYQKFSGQG